MLLKLPIEIIHITLEYLERADLNSLCRVSKYFYFVTVPFLYKSVTLKTDEEDEDFDDWGNVGAILQAPTHPIDPLIHLRTIEIKSRARVAHGCFHRDPYLDTKSDSESDSESDGQFDSGLSGKSDNEAKNIPKVDRRKYGHLRYPMNTLLQIIARCMTDKLESFIWGLGMCVPEELFGSSGLLLEKQKNLKSISLRTGGSCRFDHEEISLSGFRYLENISWPDLDNRDHIIELCSALQYNSTHLLSLDIGISNWYLKPMHFMKRSLANEIANISDRYPGIGFPTLQHVCFTNMDFLSTHGKLCSTFTFGSLRSLRLRLCKGWEELLHTIRDSSPTISLKSLLIESDPHMDNTETESSLALSSFLGAFEGLEELYVSVVSFSNPLSIWDSALRHKRSLRRLVYQQLSHDSDLLGDPVMAFTPSEVERLSADVSHNPLAGLNLEFLGICCNNFDILKALLSSPNIRESIRVLQLRVPEWEFDDWDDNLGPHHWSHVPASLCSFMSWAFGPKGPPFLHVIGHFDGSPSGSLRDDSLFCRDTETTDGYGYSGFQRILSTPGYLRSYCDAFGACRSMSD